MESTKPKKVKPEPGPERPADESQVGVSYIDYQDLQPLTEEQIGNLEEFIHSVLKQSTSDDWKAQYEAVNLLRQLSKYHHLQLLPYMPHFADFVRSQVENLRSNLMKNSLLFLKEFSNQPAPVQELGPFITRVFPVTLIKTIYEKNFIVTEAKQAMSRAVQNLSCPELVEVLVEGCQAKNLTLAEYSINYLLEAVKVMPEIPLQGNLIRQLLSEVDGKRMKMKKQAEAILREIKNKIGQEGIEHILMETTGDKDKTLQIMRLFEEKQTQKTDKKADFRSFLKQQKQQVVKDENTSENLI